ncbi:MAG: AAA family ATPase [Myxococcota bacterium]|nr:AAA family ATPase [Myxococcota bacterium]
MQTIAQIKAYIQARYPILYLLTHEEQRIRRALEKLSEQEGRGLYEWRCTTGLTGPEGTADERSADAASTLKRLSNITRPGLFVLYDLHPFLNEPTILRRLKDLAQLVGPRGQSILIVGPQLVVPVELEKMITVLDFPLPGREEVSRLLSVLCKSQKIRISPARFERFVKGALGLTEDEIKRLYARILLGGGRFSEDDLSLQIQEKRQAIRRSRFLEFWDASTGMASVGGMDNLKDWLRQRALAFSQDARQFGLPEPRGLFLLGVQGCGKSLMAKAVAGMWKMPLLRLDVAAVFSSSGREEESLRETVRIAESLAPAVLWIDELEKGFLNKEGGGGEAFGYFLTWMQEKKKPVFVVATANEVRMLPPELLRKGRFDEIFFVDLPNIHERLQILDIQLRRHGRNPATYDLTEVAEETERFSGAELEQVVISALFSAFAQSRELRSEDLIDTGREMIPLAVTMDDHLKDLREWARPRARPASTDRRRIDFFSEWEEVG